MTLDDVAKERHPRMPAYLRQLFSRTELAGRRVLDVGGGDGIMSFFAATRGAADVVCLEPIGDGSSADAGRKFRHQARELGLRSVRFVPLTLQRYLDQDAQTFDVVLLHHSINHLNEGAAAVVHTDAAARDEYVALFGRLRRVLSPGADLVAADCSRRNFFSDLHMRNPLARSIEWWKHQSPWTWSAMLRDAGFCNATVQWTAPSLLGASGQVVLGNRIGAYFTTSYFVLRCQRG